MNSCQCATCQSRPQPEGGWWVVLRPRRTDVLRPGEWELGPWLTEAGARKCARSVEGSSIVERIEYRPTAKAAAA